MTFGIPSYKRPKCRTVDTLLSAGIDGSDIYVSLQSKEEIEDYKKIHPNINYVYREADCAAGNRNTLLDFLEQRPVCLLDDDIVSFSTFEKNGNFVRNTVLGLQKIEETLQIAKKYGCGLAGVAATSNGIVAREREPYSANVLLQGTVLIFTGNSIRFDDSFKMVEDYEICLRELYQGGRTIRNNYVCANKPKNGSNIGGMHERYASGELPFWIDYLAKNYPIFNPNKTMTGGSIRWK